MIIVITSASTIPTTRAATTIIFVFSSYRFFLFLLCADFLPEPVDDLLFAGLLVLLPEDTDFTDFSSGRPVLVRLLSCAVALSDDSPMISGCPMPDDFPTQDGCLMLTDCLTLLPCPAVSFSHCSLLHGSQFRYELLRSLYSAPYPVCLPIYITS